MTRRQAAVVIAVSVSAIAGMVVLAPSASRGALPPAYGGILRVPAPETLLGLDPAAPRTPFEAMIATAVYDGLYRMEAGSVVPVLAADLPELAGTAVRITLRPGLTGHDGRAITAAEVVASLERVARSSNGWLLSSLTRAPGQLDARAIDRATIEITPRAIADAEIEPLLRRADPGAKVRRPDAAALRARRRDLALDVARLLSAAPLAIAVTPDPRRRPNGAGAFMWRAGARGEIRLRAFAHAPAGTPRLAEVKILPPRARQEEVRAFELAQLDASWHGASVYGGRPVRPVASTEIPAATPVLLVPNRRGALGTDSAWAAVARSIDLGRLERVGLARANALAPGLPAPRLPPGGASPAGLVLRMVIAEGDELSRRLAEAIAGMLDEAGATLQVLPTPQDRIGAVVAAGGWDLRIVQVIAPSIDPQATLAATLAATGQEDGARILAHPRVLFDPDLRQAAADQFVVTAFLLGRRREVLHHRADLRNVGFDALGRLLLGDLSLERDPDGDVR